MLALRPVVAEPMVLDLYVEDLMTLLSGSGAILIPMAMTELWLKYIDAL